MRPILGRSFRGLLVASICLAAIATAMGQTAWVQKEFILGTFWDPAANARVRDFQADSSSFAAARAAHFNMLTGTQDYYNIDRNPGGVRWILRVARAVGLKYLVTDDRFFPVYEHPFEEENARTIFTAYRALPDSLRSALYGYMLADEPQFKADHMEAVARWKRYIEQVEPRKLVYYNLVSSYGASYNWGGFSDGDGDATLNDRERRSYEKYLDEYVTRLDPAIVSFDHYPFFKNGTIRSDYFYNLEVIRRVSGKRPFWAYPMTVDHLDYIDPDEAHLRFMYFCPIAYGAKGLVVFTYQQPNIKDYREAIVDKKGHRTKKYAMVQRLNDYVSRVVAPVVMKYQSVGIHHASAFPGQLWVDSMKRDDSPVLDSLPDSRLLVGVFGGGGEYYLFVVNKGLTPLDSARVVLKGGGWKCTASPSVVGFREQSAVRYTSVPVNFNATRSTLTLPLLSGGEGRMFRLLLRE
jgi:hypothetical protein